MHQWAKALAALAIAAILSNAASGATQKATFASDVSTTTWPLAALDPQLPSDWSGANFLVVEFRASSSQGFELGLVGDAGTVARRIHPFANVWVRASIPLRFYREAPSRVGDRAASINQPRNSYWISLEGAPGKLDLVRALSVTLRYPAQPATVEIRRVSLSQTDAGDAVLEGGAPLIDDFGQYLHTDWPGKARSLDALKREWQTEQRLLVAKAPPACRYGGNGRDRRPATGFFRVEKLAERWWLIDPQGCRFWSAGVTGAGAEPPRTEIVGRDKLFASIPTAAQMPPPDSDAQPLRDPVSFYLANLLKRFGREWSTPAAQLTARRMRAWGLNTTEGVALNEALAPTPTLRQAYVYTLRGQQFDGALVGIPDVYSEDFASQIERAVAPLLAARREDPWLIGYLIGDEPRCVTRASECVQGVLAGPATALQRRFRAELAKGDSPAARQALVHAAFARYLDLVNAALKRHDPDHLNLGIRFAGPPRDETIALARGFDVFSVAQYGWAPAKHAIDRIHALTRLPILISGFHFGVPERGMAPGLVQVLNQAERAVAYSYYLEHAAEQPAIVGALWSHWIDQPASGRPDGENYNIGWLDVTDRPYPELVAAAKASHAKLDDIHAGRLTATTRKARASEFGTPEDAKELRATASP